MENLYCNFRKVENSNCTFHIVENITNCQAQLKLQLQLQLELRLAVIPINPTTHPATQPQPQLPINPTTHPATHLTEKGFLTALVNIN